MDPVRSWRPLLVLVLGSTAAAVAAVALHTLGTLPWLQIEPSTAWLQVTPTEDVVAAVARVAALAVVYWYLASSVLYLLARLTRHARTIRVAALVTAAPVRRLVDGAVAGVLAVGLLAPPAVAAVTTPTPVEETVSTRYLPFDLPAPGPPADPSPTTSGWTEVVVAPGDNLWRIADRRLDGDGPVAPYWRRVVEENRDRIRSGNPDLIYPGEVIRLPPP